MAKQTSDKPDARERDTSVAIKPEAYKNLVKNVAIANDKMDTGRKNKSELIRDAVDSDNLHAGAFALVMKLRKMDPVKRNEFLFHLDIYCEREKFAREDLLPDRQEPTTRIVKTTKAEKDANGVPRGKDEDGVSDMRPSFLRQPGASASSDAVQQIKDDALSKVGRGNSDTPKPH